VLLALFFFLLGALYASPLAGPLTGGCRLLAQQAALSPDTVREEVIDLLKADGILEEGEQHVYFFVLGETIETNGLTLRGKNFEQYVALLRAAGLKELDHWGFYQTDGRIAFQGVADGYEHDDCIQHYRSKTSRFPTAAGASQSGVSVSMN